MSAPRQQAVRVSRQWLELLTRLQQRPGRVLIVGPVDSGKSTLAVWLADRMAENGPVASIDADVGQSRIGPPGTIGLRHGDGAEHCYFVGDVTPTGCMPAVLSGLTRAVATGEAGGRSIIIDTTGYVDGDAALGLKVAKVEMLAPVRVVAIGDGLAIRRISAAVGDMSGVQLHRVATADTINSKSPASRRQYRADRFAEVLAGSNLRWIDLHGKSVQGTADGPGGDRVGLLTGFQDAHHRLVCLGLLKSVDRRGGRILVQAPESAERATGVVFGAVCLDGDGRQIDQTRGVDRP